MKALNDPRIADALLKSGTIRSYEEILLIKSYISTLDLIKSRYATIRSEQLDYLCRAINIETFQPRSCIFQKGVFADKMYIVFSGCCSIIDSSTGGEKENSNECFSGMSFGDDAILANRPRTSSAYNESASITELLSVDRASYLAFLKDAYDANVQPPSSSCQKGSLAYVMAILEKPRHIRTAADIESMAAYFAKEIPYFQQYDSNQLRELCLIVDATKLFGQQLLFEEGQRGHAFYSILSGRVKVWVRGGKNRANAVSRRSSIDLDGDLGVMVTDLPQGITFGDQPNAIVRESSITTAEGLTQLLVIDKGEFETLLPLFESKQALDKVAILRKTSLFQQMDASHLRSFSRFLQPVSFDSEEVLYKEGWTKRDDSKANMNSPGITIIVVGECRVDVEVEVRRSAPTSTSTLAYRTDTNDTSPRSFGETKSLTSRKTYRKKCNRVDLGRVGPGGVLYYFNALDMDEEGNLHTETVTAATPIHAYTISRGDFCYKLESETREAVIREIARDTGALRAVTDEEWRKSQAWVGFKKAMSMGEKNKMENKNRSIIDSYRLLERVSYCSPSQAPVSHRRVGTPSMSPDGTPFSKTDGDVDGKKSITFTRDKHESTRVGDYDDDIEFIRKSLGTSRGPLGLPGKSKGKTTVWSSEPDSDVAASIRDMEAVALHDSKNVQKAIQRNKSRVGPKKHRLTFLNSRDSPSPLQPGTPMTYAEGTFSGIDLSTIGPVSGLEIMAESRMKVLPFSLIHVHREIINVINENDQNETRSNTEAKSNTAAGTDLALLGGRRKRLFRCHLRLCGTMKSPEAARECAEAQIQQAMLHGNQNGDTEQQSSQSHIVWRKFSGFEAIPSHHTDHFIIYCRSAPVEYGSITPPPASGVDFLTQQYPFGCKTVGQNFVCFTARPISVDLAPHLSTGPKRSPSPNRVVPPAIVTDVPPVVAVIPTAIPEPPEKKPIKSRGNKKGAVIEREDSKRISLKPETDPVKLKLIKQTSVEFIVKSMEVREPRLAASNIAIADVEATNGLKKVSSRKSLKNKLITAVTGPLHQQLQLQLRGVEGLDPLDFSPDDISSGDTSSDDSDVASVESTKGNITARKTPRQHVPPYADQHQRKRLAVPIFLLELSSFRETHATVASKADCLTFTQALVLKNDHRSNWYTCVAPLYEWMALDESTLKRLNYIIPGNNAAVDASFLPHPPDSPVSIALITGPSSSNQFTFGPTAESSVIPLNGKRISPVHTSTNTPHTSQPSIVMKNNGPGLNDGNHGLGFALGGTQEAKDKRAEQLKNLIESRRGMLLAHDKLCDNEDANRKREEKSAKFHLLPSIVSSTELGVSQYDISLALKRRNVAKQHVKLLDTLVASAPLRTVQTASADSFHRVK